jgi:hypothetical protein
MEDETFPGKYSWRRWEATSKLATFLYVTGITNSGGGTTWCGADPLGMVHHLPGWRTVLPKRGRQLRPYILGKPNWWWECQIEQGFKIKGRHRPLSPVALGICAACAPCPDCGQPYCGPECVWSPV